MFATLSMPLAIVIAGPLADHVLEPMMASEGGAARLLAPIVGTGPDAGMAILLILTGVFAVVISLIAHSVRSIRRAEELLANATRTRPGTLRCYNVRKGTRVTSKARETLMLLCDRRIEPPAGRPEGIPTLAALE